MKKKKIIKVMVAILLTSIISLGAISKLVKADTVSGSISAVKNIISSAKDTLAESGEKQLSTEEYTLISSKDNKYLEEKSTDIPYEKFTIKTDEKVSDSEEIKVTWEGHAEGGNKVSMYAWNVKKSTWDRLSEKYEQDEKDFTLESKVIKGIYNDNNEIHVKVQSESKDDDSFSFAWITDTQFYAQTYPDIFNAEINYILSNKEKEKIKYVVHTGDIVNNMEQGYQWVNADNSLKIFDNASMPYGVLAGNHDVLCDDKVNYTVYKKYFGENRYKKNSWYGGAYENNKGHYDLLCEEGNDFIVLYMGWEIGKNEYDWMNKILDKYKDRKAILCFHNYLTPEGERDETGEGIYNNVVLKNPNVSLVLCGHYSGTSNKINKIDDNNDGTVDRIVYEVLSDYQDCANGGDGYLRLMNFSAKSNTMSIKTYSPKLDDYNFYDNDEFTILLTLKKSRKTLATDYFSFQEKRAEVHKCRNEEYESNNMAKTSDMYLEMIAIILAVSGMIIVSELKISKNKNIK